MTSSSSDRYVSNVKDRVTEISGDNGLTDCLTSVYSGLGEPSMDFMTVVTPTFRLRSNSFLARRAADTGRYHFEIERSSLQK